MRITQQMMVTSALQSEATATEQRESDEINSRFYDRVTTIGEIPS